MRLTWNAALEETEMVLFESVHKLFKATGVSAQEVSHSHAFRTAWNGLQQHAQSVLPLHSVLLLRVASLLTLGYLVLSHSAITQCARALLAASLGRQQC